MLNDSIEVKLFHTFFSVLHLCIFLYDYDHYQLLGTLKLSVILLLSLTCLTLTYIFPLKINHRNPLPLLSKNQCCVILPYIMGALKVNCSQKCN